MPTTRDNDLVVKNLVKTLFFAGVFFTSVCFVDSWRWVFFMNAHFIVLKFALAFIIPTALTALAYHFLHSLEFMGTACKFISNLYVAIFVLDIFTYQVVNSLGDFMIIYHLGYGLISLWSVFFCATAIKYFNKNKPCYYHDFCNEFFNGEVVILGFAFIMIYFVIRDYNCENIVNLKLFNGEIKETILSNSINKYVRTIGNVFVYSAISMTIIRFCKKNKYLWGIIIPILFSIGCESFQYLLSCGDTDIDDVFTNVLGVIIGVIVHKFVIAPLLKSGEKI